MKSIAATVGLLLIGSALIVSCQDEGSESPEPDSADQADSVTAALGGASDLSISSRLIGSAGLGQALDGEGSYTIFAPVDDAWSELGSEELQTLETSEGRPQLIAVLRQHIASGAVLEADMAQAFERSEDALTLAAMGAAPITLRRDGEAVIIGEEDGGPRIVGAPIIVGNDVIYRVDGILPPPR